MKIKNIDKEFIEKLKNESEISRMCDIFDSYSKLYEKSGLIYFGTQTNPQLLNLKNELHNGYSIFGLSEYEKSFIFDSRSGDSKARKYIEYAKMVNLDLNILTYLKNIVENKKIDDYNEFIAYLKYIKDSNYGLNIGCSILERVSKPMDLNIWSKYILSYVKYECVDKFDENELRDDVRFSEEDYRFAMNILDTSLSSKERLEQFYVIFCILAKSYLLKLEENDLKTKIIKLLDYSLNELGIYLEFELYLMYKFLSDDEITKRFFSKMNNFSEKILKNIENTTWDILHIRLIEKQMINDFKNGQIIFHFLGTKDKGLQSIVNINPIKIIGYLNDQEIVVRRKNINEIFMDTEINNMIFNYGNKINIEIGSYKDKFQEIINELKNIIRL